ncbi:MAG: hypothetical protein EOP73_29505 [Variovorax sp.]|nr:MAG: hypothetical protein EOP73_29505 [Variovorax sp.]
MHVKRVAHIAVATAQLDTMKAVLGDVLGLPLLREARFESGTEMAMFQLGDLNLEVLQNPLPDSLPGRFMRESLNPGSTSGYYHVCLEVDDLQATLKELAAKGARPLGSAPRKGHAGAPVVFLDPATTGGLLIELEQAHAEVHAPPTPSENPIAI